MRKEYRNGDEVGLKANGCDGCSPSMINGRLVHESGCPDAWRDTPCECRECGGEFFDRNATLCPGCSDSQSERRWESGNESYFESED